MFERFTEQARAAVVQAQLEARELGHGSLGTEHLLLGAIAEDRGRASRVLADAGVEADGLRATLGSPLAGIDADALAAIGIDLDAVRARTEEAFGPGALARRRGCDDGRIPFTREAKRALELSLREAVALGDDSIGTTHLLLALAHVGDDTSRFLDARGLGYGRLRQLLRDAA